MGNLFYALLLISLMPMSGFADSTQNTKVQMEQGGQKLKVLSGGSIVVDSGGTLTIGGTNPFQVPISVVDARSTAVVVQKALAPITGSISTLVCVNDVVLSGTGANVILKGKINGALITNGSVTINSSSVAYSVITATATAANTVTADVSVLSIETDGGSTVGVGPSIGANGVHCSFLISP